MPTPTCLPLWRVPLFRSLAAVLVTTGFLGAQASQAAPPEAVAAGPQAAAAEGNAEPLDLLIVAGQSNAVGFDTDPSALPPDESDRQIRFWWRCGDPPPDPFDSTSGGQWATLRAQPRGTPKTPRADRQYGNFATAGGGFGPEIGLARALYAAQKRPLAVVKVAFSGTGMKRDWNPRDPGDGGACYRALVTEVRKAVAAAAADGVVMRPRALAWVQGESDANATDAENYAAALGEMVTALRRDLQAPRLTALLAVNVHYGGTRQQFIPTIVAQQQALSRRDPLCQYVDTSPASIANGAHFDSAGTLLVGKLFAEHLQRLEAKRQPAARQFTIVTLGDSITKGVRAGVRAEDTFASRLETSLSTTGISARVVNVGIGGERTDQALQRLERVLALKPDFVTIMYGTNDSYVDQGASESRISRKAYRDNLQAMIVRLLSSGVQPVLMTEPRWAADAANNGAGENPNVRLAPYMEACREAAREWRLPLIDHFADWTAAEEGGTNLRDWTTDGCHPNPEGHARLAAAILPVLSATIAPPLQTRKKLLAGEAARIVCFGDSVTGVYYHTGSRRAYTDMLGTALRRIAPVADLEMINAGVSGHTTANGLSRIEKDVLAHKPDLVTVMFGLNDMVRVPLEQYRANLKEIVARCRAAGAEVILATPNAVIDTPARPIAKLVSYCDVVRAVARELRVPLCDCYQRHAALREHAPFVWRLTMSDPIHPNMAGHKRLATELAQTLAGLRVELDDLPPPTPALPHLRARLQEGAAVRVLAMTPVDQGVREAIRAAAPAARVEVEVWNVEGAAVDAIEQQAKARVRTMKPDLVVIAAPRAPATFADEPFANAFAWTMNWSLNFGPPTWDVVVVHPSVAEGKAGPPPRQDLIRQLVAAQDLHLIDRPAGNEQSLNEILADWFRRHLADPK